MKSSLLLWPEAELPEAKRVKPSWVTTVVKKSKEAKEEVKKLLDKMQLNFNHLLTFPVVSDVVKRKRKPKSRAYIDEDFKKEYAARKKDEKVFIGSVTVTVHRSEEDQRNVLKEWTNAHLWEAHCWVLEESMEALKALDNDEEKLDVLDWMFSPPYIEKVGKTHDGRPCMIRRHASDIPFSFVLCCNAAGVTDPETFREMLVERISEDFRPKLEKFLRLTQGTK